MACGVLYMPLPQDRTTFPFLSTTITGIGCFCAVSFNPSCRSIASKIVYPAGRSVAVGRQGQHPCARLEMRPDEIHPEVVEKLDGIMRAFGL